MPNIQVDDQTFQIAQRRAVDGGYSSVAAYITDVVAHDVEDAVIGVSDLDHRFTPEVVADLELTAAAARNGAKTYSAEEVREHFRKKSDDFQKLSGE